MKDGELIGKVHNSHYQQCRKRGYPLRFSKSGKAETEKAYATHYVNSIRIAALKERGRSYV